MCARIASDGQWRFPEAKLSSVKYEKALVYSNGRYVRTVGPGMHWLWLAFHRQTAVLFDMRKQSFSLSGQEILTKNRVPIRLTIAVTYQVSDPVAAQHRVDSWSQQLYLDVQLALREIVAGYVGVPHTGALPRL